MKFRGTYTMVNFYVVQIKLGNMSIEDVPNKYKEKVNEILGA